MCMYLFTYEGKHLQAITKIYVVYRSSNFS